MAFTINPLEWTEHRPESHPDGGYFYTSCVFSSLSVYAENGRYWWSYCVDEYYDEGQHDGTSVDDCKRQAEEWYMGRLTPALAPVSE